MQIKSEAAESNLNISDVKFSRKDIKKGITIPSHLSPELSEDIGIMIGDGSIFRQTKKFGFKIRCSGDPNEEKEYYDNFITRLKNNLFHTNLMAKMIYQKRKNEYGIDFNSQAIALFYMKVIGLPCGKKESVVDIPDMIKNSNDEHILINCIRGIFDTDGSLTFKKKGKDFPYYPVLKFSSASKKLVLSIKNTLLKLGFTLWAGFDLERYDKRFNKYYIQNEIDLSGKKNLELWKDLINFDNPKHITKYLIWKKFGFCPSKIDLNDRLKILDESTDPNIFLE